MWDTTGGEACNDEGSASESSFGSLAVCYGGDSTVSAWFSSWRWFSRPEWCLADFANRPWRRFDDATDCARSLDLTCMKCDKRVSVVEHLHNLSPFLCIVWSKCPPRLDMLLYILSRLGSICRGLASAEAWHAILYLATPWQYLLRLGMLF